MTPGEDFVFERSEFMEFEHAEPTGPDREDTAPSAGELLTLHGRSVLDYAALCTKPSRGAAERLAGQAFRNIYGDAASHAGADFPWRPRLLAAVLEATREWNADDRRSSLHPDLRGGPTSDARRTVSGADRGSVARSLVLRALRNLPDRAQVLLWHTVVEAEGIEAVAPLLGAEPSLLNPERARTLLRDECVRVHLDLAPDERCRRLNRLIDVHARRGAIEMMAEVREHLDGCAYCGAAVDQLDQSPDRLPGLIAEAVLGFRAADYLATRPARRAVPLARARSEPAPQPTDAESRRTSVGDPEAWRRRWPLLVAVGVVLCGVIAASPMALSETEDDSQAVGSSVPGATRSPSGFAAPPAAPRSPSASAAPDASETLFTRLRNVRTGLCLDLRASAEVVGTPAVTAQCGESATQMWLLEEGGRLRNQAAPELCLTAEPQGTVALRPCTDPEGPDGEESGDARYDMAADGLLTLVAEPGVAVTPVRGAEGAIILLEPVPQDRLRRSQRWSTDEDAAGVTSREG